MALRIDAIRNISFSSQSSSSNPKKENAAVKTDANPISEKGEKMKLLTATFIGGLGLGVRLLAELLDGDFLGEKIYKKGVAIGKDRTQHLKPADSKVVPPNLARKQALIAIAAMLGISGLLIGGFAILYTLFNAPKISYNGKVNAFTKGKDMDVYIKGNSTEKELYNQMNDKAKSASTEEKDKLKMQYAQLRIAKNELPDFLKGEKTLQNLAAK